MKRFVRKCQPGKITGDIQDRLIRSKEMAALLDVKRTTYANWEKNTEPNIITIPAITKILSI